MSLKRASSGESDSEGRSKRAFKMKVADLRDTLKAKGLDTSGLKADLVSRLDEAIQTEETIIVSSTDSPPSLFGKKATSQVPAAPLPATELAVPSAEPTAAEPTAELTAAQPAAQKLATGVVAHRTCAGCGVYKSRFSFSKNQWGKGASRGASGKCTVCAKPHVATAPASEPLAEAVEEVEVSLIAANGPTTPAPSPLPTDAGDPDTSAELAAKPATEPMGPSAPDLFSEETTLEAPAAPLTTTELTVLAAEPTQHSSADDIMMHRACAGCRVATVRGGFSITQWSKGASAKCTGCTKRNMPAVPALTPLPIETVDPDASVGPAMGSVAEFVAAQPATKPSAADMMTFRACAGCGVAKVRDSFSKNQWSKGASGKCTGCSKRHTLTALPSEPSMAVSPVSVDRPAVPAPAPLPIKAADPGASAEPAMERVAEPTAEPTAVKKVAPDVRTYRACAACGVTNTREGFSITQWSKGASGKCMGCTKGQIPPQTAKSLPLGVKSGVDNGEKRKSDKDKSVCYAFQQTGSCGRGRSCWFSHEIPSNVNSTGEAVDKVAPPFSMGASDAMNGEKVTVETAPREAEEKEVQESPSKRAKRSDDGIGQPSVGLEVPELQAELSKRGLTADGLKADVVARLDAAVITEAPAELKAELLVGESEAVPKKHGSTPATSSKEPSAAAAFIARAWVVAEGFDTFKDGSRKGAAGELRAVADLLDPPSATAVAHQEFLSGVGLGSCSGGFTEAANARETTMVIAVPLRLVGILTGKKNVKKLKALSGVREIWMQSHDQQQQEKQRQGPFVVVGAESANVVLLGTLRAVTVGCYLLHERLLQHSAEQADACAASGQASDLDEWQDGMRERAFKAAVATTAAAPSKRATATAAKGATGSALGPAPLGSAAPKPKLKATPKATARNEAPKPKVKAALKAAAMNATASSHYGGGGPPSGLQAYKQSLQPPSPLLQHQHQQGSHQHHQHQQNQQNQQNRHQHQQNHYHQQYSQPTSSAAPAPGYAQNCGQALQYLPWAQTPRDYWQQQRAQLTETPLGYEEGGTSRHHHQAAAAEAILQQPTYQQPYAPVPTAPLSVVAQQHPQATTVAEYEAQVAHYNASLAAFGQQEQQWHQHGHGGHGGHGGRYR